MFEIAAGVLAQINPHSKDLSVIGLSQGLDAILREIESVRKLQYEQLVSSTAVTPTVFWLTSTKATY